MKIKSWSPITRRALRLNATLACAFTVVLSACGGGGAGSVPPLPVSSPSVAEVKPGIWVVIGSSTAAGAGALPGGGWVDLLQLELRSKGAQLANIARGGSVTYHGMSVASTAPVGRPAPDGAINVDYALSRSPAVLLVSYPTNDTALGYSVDETVNNILAIRSVALIRQVPVLILSTQPRNLSFDQLAKLRVIDERLSAAVGPCFVPINSLLAAQDGRLAAAFDSGDGVHPNPAGHRLIADRVNAHVARADCIRLVG